MDGLKSKYAAREGDAAAQRDIANQMIALAQQTADKTTRIYADGLTQQERDRLAELQKMKQQWDATVNPLVSSFTSGLLQMAEGTKSFAQVMRSIGQQIVEDFLRNVVDRKVEGWLWSETSQTGATTAQSTIRKGIQALESLFGITTAKTQAVADITASAGQAFAAAFAATAAIPVIGPELAPGVASQAYGSTIAAVGMSLASGGFDIPPGVNPLTQLHAEEMVLPASIARPLRSMIAANDAGANDGAASGGGRGDTHHHYHYSISALDGPSVQRVLENNRSYHAAAMDSLVRSRNGRGFGST
jgi:hypothetical protein